MTEHIFDELPRLLTGQSTRDELRVSVAHLRVCVDCQQELIEALAAHASLSSAARYTPEARIHGLLGEADDGGDNVIGARFGQDRDAASAEVTPETLSEVAPGSLATPLPDLSALFSAVRSDAAGADGLDQYRITYQDLRDDADAHAASDDAATATATAADDVSVRRRQRSTSSRRGFSARWLVAAAAVGLGLGSAAVLTAQHKGAPATTNVALAAYDVGSVPATAKLVGSDDMKLDATALPKPASGSLYEVWLTNANRTKMHALGWIDSTGKGEFTLPTQLLDEYTAIEVSVQKLNSSYDYSGTSVLRGTY